MRSRLPILARVALVSIVLAGGPVSAWAASQDPAAAEPDTSSNGVSAEPEPRPVSQESAARSGGFALRRLIAQEFRVATVLSPGSLGQSVDPFWAEIEYRPKITGKRSRVSGAAEVLFRATMSGFAFSPDGSSPDRARGSLRVQSDRQAAMIKQLSFSLDTPVDVVIGWQILSWGHATDGVRVLDLFQREDLTDRLRPEQLGIPAVSASFGNGEWEAEAVWVPSSPTDRIATRTSNVWYAFPRSSVVDAAGPGFSLSNGEGGIRAGRYGQRGDYAVIVARARDRVPSVLEFSRDPLGTLQARSLYEPYWLVGASAVRTVGAYVLRAEALRATYAERISPLVKNGIRSVAGVERRVSGPADSHYTLIAQYATDTTGSAQILQEGAHLASPFRVYRHALTGSATAAWGQQYELEMRVLRELNRGSMVTSTKFSYRRSDHLTLWLAADIVSGRRGTWLERLDAADRILAGINVNP